MVQIYHHSVTLSDQPKPLAIQEGLPIKAQSILFDNVSSTIAGDTYVSFDKGSQFHVIVSGGSLTVSAAAGTTLDFNAGEKLRLWAATSGTLLKILIVG